MVANRDVTTCCIHCKISRGTVLKHQENSHDNVDSAISGADNYHILDTSELNDTEAVQINPHSLLAVAGGAPNVGASLLV